MTQEPEDPSGNGQKRFDERPGQEPETPGERIRTGPARGRGRRNVVGGSPHRDDYVRLMEAGWSSATLERYAAFRYGEEISDRAFRRYRARRGIADPRTLRDDEKHPFDQPIDVLQERLDLIALQKARIDI